MRIIDEAFLTVRTLYFRHINKPLLKVIFIDLLNPSLHLAPPLLFELDVYLLRLVIPMLLYEHAVIKIRAF